MSHWKTMFDNKYIGAHDLPAERDVVVTIESVSAETLTSQRGQNKKPVMKFVGKEKGFVANKTNAKAIAAMYGHETDAWKGKQIALYVTQTSSPDGLVDCIRVRPTIPKRARTNSAKGATSPTPDLNPENVPEDPDHGP